MSLLLGCASRWTSMANTPELTVSDLADILAALTEVTKPYQFGIQLKIALKVIERDYSDIDRQKTEVIEHWLHNSPDASWTTLANAVERMGGHSSGDFMCIFLLFLSFLFIRGYRMHLCMPF